MIFKKTEGEHNPLTGSEAEAVAWSLLKLGCDEEAKDYLLAAIETSSQQQNAWGDGRTAAPALTSAMQTVDRILAAHRRTDDRQGLEKYFSAIERLCHNVCGRLRLSKERPDAPIYERLISSCSMVMVASGTAQGTSRSQELLKTYMWQQPDTVQAQLCNELLFSLQNGENGSNSDSAPSPAMMAFAKALAAQGGR